MAKRAPTSRGASAKRSKFNFDSDQEGAESVTPSALLRRKVGPKAVPEDRGVHRGNKAPAKSDGETNDDKVDTGTGSSVDGDDNVHEEALERYQAGWSKDRENQAEGYTDLKFLADTEEGGQWEDTARKNRVDAGRPILTVNKTEQFVRQVTGDIRQMRPAIKCVPVDDAASEDVAVKILPGMVRYIEQRSDAKASYFNGIDQAASAGIGHWRVFTEYAAGTTMNQEIGVGLIEDGLAVVWDPDAIHPTRKDAGYCFVPVDMAKKAAEKRWPKGSFEPLDHTLEAFTGWYTDDHVRVCEYWRKVPFKRELAVYADGSVVDLTGDDDGSKRADALAGVPPNPATNDPGQPPATIEKRDSYKVQRYIVSAAAVLEGPEEWPGVHIPIVPCLGTETKIGRRIVRRGVVRPLRDVQRLYNYAISADAEFTALQPKAPFVGTKKNFEEHQTDWENANVENLPYLRYTPDATNGSGPPQRQPPPSASTGIHELLQTSTADMSGVTGIYPSGLGQASNETSGKAILARQREGDTGTYHYVEAFGRAVQRTGEIIVDLIPHIYDSERVIRIVGEDGKIDKMELNKSEIDPNGDGIATRVLNDVTVGCYEISVEMGPSFNTKREEARDGLQQLMPTLGPEGAMLIADLFVKSQDFPLADQIAKRLSLVLPPQIQQAEAIEAGKPPPATPQAPEPQPTPADKIKLAEAQANHEVNMKRLALDSRKIDKEFAAIDAELEVARLDHRSDMAGHAIDATHKAAQGMQDAEQAALDRAHAAGQGDLDRSAAAASAAAAAAPDGSAAPAATGPENGGQTSTDPRVDELIQAVSQLRDMVLQIAQAITAPPDQGAPPGAAGGPPPGITMDPGAMPPADATMQPGIAPPA